MNALAAFECVLSCRRFKSFCRNVSLNTFHLFLSVNRGEKPHSCDVCHKAFARKSALRTHLSVHTGEKPHRCGVCNKSFSRKWRIKAHMLVHTGEKPHSCECIGFENGFMFALNCEVD
ncbi:hypothetical protein JTE90_011417 [Oedothorax gibbosus]|uniref:C2H2-type domain-containing protein n=1 Tax=Oedothorax gibbosus TaxID=931172 RepID=A0AAV6VDW7_9ARAC|nr:hypothetical protein JTE90_011417 [Oedothorax gibbosus]